MLPPLMLVLPIGADARQMREVPAAGRSCTQLHRLPARRMHEREALLPRTSLDALCVASVQRQGVDEHVIETRGQAHPPIVPATTDL